MSKNKKRWSRRNFLKAAGAAGIGSIIAPPLTGRAGSAEKGSVVATRPFGKTGVNVSILSLGGMFDIASNQLLMKQALNWGVTYWDTADCYQRGSERGIGKFFSRRPDAREKIFLVSKSDARDPDGMTRLLDRSLDRLKTDYIDLYFVHAVSDIDELDDRTKAWAEEAKSAGKIRFFGFSTHRNMEECMLKAAQLGWIDGIMMTYNYRLMHSDDMQRAVDACVEAGIGLTAMKTQGGGQLHSTSDTEQNLAGSLVQKGYSDAQARLKAVWDNPQIACICSEMPNTSILMANAAAAMNKTSLSATDRKLLFQYAHETRSDYCAGCSRFCSEALGRAVPINRVMRCLMYYHAYQDPALAHSTFQTLPPETRAHLKRMDFRKAENACPRDLPIGKLVREAADLLA